MKKSLFLFALLSVILSQCRLPSVELEPNSGNLFDRQAYIQWQGFLIKINALIII